MYLRLNNKSNYTLTLVILLITAAYNCYAQKKRVLDKLIVLTFDDAVKSQFTVAAPLLRKYQFGATFFVCEFPGMFGDTSNSMSWAEIKQLSKWGFDIGNHTWHHVNIDRLIKDSLKAEIEYINKKCDSIGIPKPINFAYPAYVTDSSKIIVLKRTGLKTARIGGDKAYHPENDNAFYIPSFTPGDDLQKAISAIKQAKEGAIVVLAIHGVPDKAHPWVNTSPEVFESYLKYLKDNHYKVISMRGLEKYIHVENK
jgi:peptidoglycan/xylan/chitin deacetylase (PgdA/CDA1 family)